MDLYLNSQGRPFVNQQVLSWCHFSCYPNAIVQGKRSKLSLCKLLVLGFSQITWGLGEGCEHVHAHTPRISEMVSSICKTTRKKQKVYCLILDKRAWEWGGNRARPCSRQTGRELREGGKGHNSAANQAAPVEKKARLVAQLWAILIVSKRLVHTGGWQVHSSACTI